MFKEIQKPFSHLTNINILRRERTKWSLDWRWTDVSHLGAWTRSGPIRSSALLRFGGLFSFR